MMGRFIKKMFKDEDGQVMVLFSLFMVVIFGLAALVIDVGQIQVTRVSMQNVADAAALAAAQELPDKSKAISVAESVANLHGVDKANIVVTTPYKGDSKKIKVECTENVDFSFAKVLGFTNKKESLSAVAEKNNIWNGEALPFINLAFDYSINDPIAWTKVGPGIKGTLTDFYTRNQGKEDAYFELTYKDGLVVTMGYANGTKGLDDSKLSDGIKKVLTKDDMGVKKVYLFSLRSDIIQSGKFTVNNKSETVSLSKLNDLKNTDVIDPDQLVLIQCLFLDLKWDNHHDIELKYLGNVYDLGNDVLGKPLPDFPTEFLTSKGGLLRLVE